MKKILVLGASGYIGSQLLPLLIEKNYQVTAATRNIPHLQARIPATENLNFVYLDF